MTQSTQLTGLPAPLRHCINPEAVAGADSAVVPAPAQDVYQSTALVMTAAPRCVAAWGIPTLSGLFERIGPLRKAAQVTAYWCDTHTNDGISAAICESWHVPGMMRATTGNQWFCGATHEVRLQALSMMTFGPDGGMWSSLGAHRMVLELKQKQSRGPAALRTMRIFCDRVLGPHNNAVAARKTANKYWKQGFPNKGVANHFGQFAFSTQSDRYWEEDMAYVAFDMLVLARDLVSDPFYAAAIYEPYRLERAEALHNPLVRIATVAVGAVLLGLSGFFFTCKTS